MQRNEKSMSNISIRKQQCACKCDHACRKHEYNNPKMTLIYFFPSFLFKHISVGILSEIKLSKKFD